MRTVRIERRDSRGIVATPGPCRCGRNTRSRASVDRRSAVAATSVVVLALLLLLLAVELVLQVIDLLASVGGKESHRGIGHFAEQC